MSRFQVGPPPYAPSPFGLLDLATVPVTDDPHEFQNGVQWDPSCYGAAGVTEGGCEDVTPGDPPAGYDKTGNPTGFGAVAEATRFVVYRNHQCGTGGRTTDEQRNRAIEALVRSEVRTIEAVFERGGPTDDGAIGGWAGSLAANATVLTADPNPIEFVIGRLEAELGWRYGGVGALHLTYLLAQLAIAKQLLTVSGGKLRTVLGTPVAVGTGYLGTGPGGPSADSQTAYATGPVVAWRDTPLITGDDSSGLRLDVNTREIVAERQVILGWECGAYAAAVDLSAYHLDAPEG